MQEIRDRYDIFGEDLCDLSSTVQPAGQSGQLPQLPSHSSRVTIKTEPQKGYGVGYQVSTELDDSKSQDLNMSQRSHISSMTRSQSPILNELTFKNHLLEFDVYLDRDLIYSKAETRRFPITVDILIRLGICGEDSLGGKGIARDYFHRGTSGTTGRSGLGSKSRERGRF